MAAIAPDPTESATPGWLGSFVETWEPGTGAPIEDREPATGRLIATVRGSTPDDVARAAAEAKAAQPAWAATNYQERARDHPPRRRDLRRQSRRVRDVDPARDRAPRSARCTTSRTSRTRRSSTRRPCHRSRTARSCRRRSRAGCRWSGGCRSGSSARSRRGTRRRCSGCASSPRPWPSATPSSSSPTRRRRSSAGRCSRRSSGRPACPRASSRSSSAAPMSARRSSPTRTSRSCRSPARPRSVGGSAQLAGGHAQEGLARARWQQRVHRPRRRRPRCRRGGRGVLVLPVPGPGVLRGRAPPRPARAWPATTPPRSPRRRSACAWAIRIARTSSSGRSSTRSSSGRVDDIVQRSIADGGRVLEGGTHEGLFYRPTVLT